MKSGERRRKKAKEAWHKDKHPQMNSRCNKWFKTQIRIWIRLFRTRDRAADEAPRGYFNLYNLELDCAWMRQKCLFNTHCIGLWYNQLLRHKAALTHNSNRPYCNICKSPCQRNLCTAATRSLHGCWTHRCICWQAADHLPPLLQVSNSRRPRNLWHG